MNVLSILTNHRKKNVFRNTVDPKRKTNKLSWTVVYIFVYLIVLIKFLTLKEYQSDFIFALYSLSVSTYILIRFGLSFFYEPEEEKLNPYYMPTVTFAVPAKNEEENIDKTLIAIANSDYPKERLEIIAVNDGSTDKTFEKMQKAKHIASEMGVQTQIINWERNRGKREGMAEAIELAQGEVIVFVDSDSFVKPNTLKEMLKYFVNDKVAIVTAHTLPYNSKSNFITKIQTIHYYISFKVFKSTESLFGAVTCCPGCCSAYKKKVIINEVEEFKEQCFLGSKCTYGDDRSLTNTILKKGYKSIYSPSAIAFTVVPDNFKQFSKQQLRWKKSWTKESLRASKFFWKKNPLIGFIFYLGIVLTFLSPVIVFRAVVWYPIVLHTFPTYYIFGLFIMSTIFAFYYRINTDEKFWYLGIVYSSFYSLFLFWQFPYALITLKDPNWGTR